MFCVKKFNNFSREILLGNKRLILYQIHKTFQKRIQTEYNRKETLEKSSEKKVCNEFHTKLDSPVNERQAKDTSHSVWFQFALYFTIHCILCFLFVIPNQIEFWISEISFQITTLLDIIRVIFMSDFRSKRL